MYVETIFSYSFNQDDDENISKANTASYIVIQKFSSFNTGKKTDFLSYQRSNKQCVWGTLFSKTEDLFPRKIIKKA